MDETRGVKGGRGAVRVKGARLEGAMMGSDGSRAQRQWRGAAELMLCYPIRDDLSAWLSILQPNRRCSCAYNATAASRLLPSASGEA